MKIILSLCVCLLAITSYSQRIIDYDKNKYKTVKVGDKEWMSENLKVTHYNNGDEIFHAQTKEEWVKYSKEEKGCWSYASTNTKEILYNFYAIEDKRGIAMDGWRVSSNEDWISLINLIGGEREGTKIKGKKWNGGNKFGLNIIPAGYRDGYGDFQRMTDMALFWINESIDKKTAWYYSINETGDIEKYFLGDLKGIGHSIRLVKK